MKTIAINPEKCVGCRICELACSLKNTGEFNPARSRVQVVGFEEAFSVPVTCFQCERPYCLEVCPAHAIRKDPATGVVSVSADRCTGCKICMLACPFGNIVVSGVDRVAVKCELCGGEPECVLFCPTRALELKEADKATISKRSALAEKLRDVYQDAR